MSKKVEGNRKSGSSVEFTTLERIILSALIPKEADLTTIRIVRDLAYELSFSEEEHSKLQFKVTEKGQVQWKEDGSVKAVEIGAKARLIINEALTALDKEKKLTVDHISLCEKFL